MAKANSAKKPASKSTSTPTAKTLLQMAKSLPPPRPPSFLDRLPPDLQQEFLDLRAAYQAKRLPAHMSATRIYAEVVIPQHPDACSQATFRRWMAEVRNG